MSAEQLRIQAAQLAQAGRLPEALNCLHQLLQLDPTDVKILADCGLAHVMMGQTGDALAAYQRASDLAPDWAEPLKRLGEIRMTMDQPDVAASHFERALALVPNDTDSLVKAGIAQAALGDKDRAKGYFTAALALDQYCVPALYNLSGLGKFDEAQTVGLTALEARIEGLRPQDRLLAHFTLAKFYQNRGDDALAFDHYHAGNRAKRALFAYDVEADIRRMEETERVVTRDLLARFKGGGLPTDMPVFVVGMPRSGSTLIEQILASHPMVAGAGEIAALPEIMRRINGADGQPVAYPHVMEIMPPDAARTIADLYLRIVVPKAKGRARVVDKFLDNFLYAGVISAALPNARILHSRRDPVDTCLSCYTLLFGTDQKFAYDMTELGRYWRAYDRLMAHWRSILPSDRFIEVHYEQVVADLEPQVRLLLERLGLPFEPRCLDFHKTQRVVMTASAQQVRQPIYSASVGRWKKHAPYIGPLLDALAVLP